MPNKTLDRAIRTRTRHMWVGGLGIFVSGPLLYMLAQAMSREWAYSAAYSLLSLSGFSEGSARCRNTLKAHWMSHRAVARENEIKRWRSKCPSIASMTEAKGATCSSWWPTQALLASFPTARFARTSDVGAVLTAYLCADVSLAALHDVWRDSGARP
jgi:hypothetical protein